MQEIRKLNIIRQPPVSYSRALAPQYLLSQPELHQPATSAPQLDTSILFQQFSSHIDKKMEEVKESLLSSLGSRLTSSFNEMNEK